MTVSCTNKDEFAYKLRRDQELKGKSPRVRFQEHPIVFWGAVLGIHEYTEEERKNSWWNEKEREGARLNARYLSSSQAKKASAFTRKLESSFKETQAIACVAVPAPPTIVVSSRLADTCCSSSTSDRRQVVEVGHEFDLLDHCDDHFCSRRRIISYLSKWSMAAHSLRGLERWVSPEHGRTRLEFTVLARDLVLQMYRIHRLPEEEIAEHYARATHTSVLFARFLGLADSIAVNGAKDGDPILPVEHFLSIAMLHLAATT